MIEYEIYVDSVYGSDVVVKDTLEEAIKCAEEWSMNTHCVDSDVIIEKVERQIVKTFRHGCEVG